MASLEQPAPIVPAAAVRESLPWTDVVRKKSKGTDKQADDMAKEREQVNASSYLVSRRGKENEAPHRPLSVRIALPSKHDIRMMVPRSMVDH